MWISELSLLLLLLYVEVECGESRGMGTEAYRKTKRVAGMGCRTSAAAEPTPNCPFGRLGAKDLTIAWVCSSVLPLSQAPDLLSRYSLTYCTLSALYSITPSYFYFYLTPGPVLSYNNCKRQ